MAAPTVIACPNCGRRNRVTPHAEGAPRCAVCHALLPWIVEADASSYEEETASSLPVVVDFWAVWCGPCRMMSPVVERLARERAGEVKVVKVDVDAAPEIARRYDVRGIPTLVLLSEGRELDRLVGAAPPRRLTGWLEAHLPQAGAAAESQRA